MSVLLVTGHPDAARVLRCSDVRFGSMLSKKSKIEELRKSRKDQVLVVSVTASLCRACTKVCDRFAAIRCGPSRARHGTHQRGWKILFVSQQKLFRQHQAFASLWPRAAHFRSNPRSRHNHGPSTCLKSAEPDIL